MKNNDEIQNAVTRIAEEIVKLLEHHAQDPSVADLALTKVLAAMYSTLPEDVAERLIKLHTKNLRCTVWEIRMAQQHKLN